MTNHFDSEAWLAADYAPVASYYVDSDCVEYVSEDTLCVYERIDSFLTLVYDETKFRVIGFKLKGFRYVIGHHLKAHLQLNDRAFVKMATAIEAICQQIGDSLFEDDRRSRAYQAARKIAEQGNVELTDPDLMLAA